MLIKTKGVVFRFTRYGDSSLIVTMFTEHAGIQSYMVKGIRKTRSGSGMALYQPLTLLELVVYNKESAGLQHIREVRCMHIYRRIPGNVFRETLAFFITELLNKSIREQSHTEELFHFIEESLLQLDGEQVALSNFHLHFMSRLSRYLGFGAQNSHEITGNKVLPDELSGHLQKILDGENPEMNYQSRKEVLELFSSFFREHIENFGNLKSVDVLHEILSQAR